MPDNSYYFDYYNHDNVEDVTFDGYQVTTNNPGIFLLFLTVIVCISCFFVGILVFPNSPLHPIYRKFISMLQEFGILGEKEAKQVITNETDIEGGPGAPGFDSFAPGGTYYVNQKDDASTIAPAPLSGPKRAMVHIKEKQTTVITRGAVKGAGPRGKKSRYTAKTLNTTITVAQKRKAAKIRISRSPASGETALAARIGTGLKKRISSAGTADSASVSSEGRLGFEDLTFYLTKNNYDGGRPSTANSKGGNQNGSLGEGFLDDETVISNSSFLEGTGLWAEVKEIMALAAPWMLQSVIAYGEDIIYIIIISHFLGLRAMICYSNVWFIASLTHIINDAWYSAIYKHVNIACGQETDEGYVTAGKYIKIGMAGNFFISVPTAILTVLCMPWMMNLLGYHQSIVDLSQQYSIVVVLSRLMSSTSGLLNSIMDMEGRAKFVAIFEFWESLIAIVLTLAFVTSTGPSLLSIGVFHLILDLVATGIFFFWVIEKRGWYVGYSDGIFSPLSSVNFAHVKMVLSMTLPMLGEQIIGNIEGFVFTIFAAYQGSAEAATWILLSYIWAFVELAPESYAEAAATRVTRHLSKGRREFAQAVSFHSIKVGTLISIVCSATLYVYGPFFVWCLSLDDTLEQMLLELIPYAVLCQPFVSIGMTAMELNDSLHIYKQATYIMTAVTLFIMIPIAAVLTYWFGYNIEGLAAAQCIGYVAAGVANIVIFMNADWDRAVRKAQQASEL